MKRFPAPWGHLGGSLRRGLVGGGRDVAKPAEFIFPEWSSRIPLEKMKQRLPAKDSWESFVINLSV